MEEYLEYSRKNCNRKIRRKKAQKRLKLIGIIVAIMLSLAIFLFLQTTTSLTKKDNNNEKANLQPYNTASIADKDTSNEKGNPQQHNITSPAKENVNKASSNSQQTEVKVQHEKEISSTNANSKKDDDIKTSTTTSDWNLILVNPWNKLPKGYSVYRITLSSGHSIDKRVYPYLQKMLDDCRKEGLSPIICSSYRTMEKQQSLFNRQVSKYISLGYSKEKAEIEAAKWVAIPGTSEHQLGLAVDIVAHGNQNLDKSQEKTPEQQWLIKNCYKYGFIMRYPSNKSDITGIGYEPWHYRYVGKEAAAEIMRKGICLEQYLKGIGK